MTDTMIPTMTRTLGTMPTSMPKGFFKAVHFPVLAMLDTQTGDHRMLLADGADSRVLPLSIKFASKTGYGHEGAEVSGALFQVTIDPGNNVMSGDGFLLDDENGRRHARLIYTGAMNGNSVDLAEVKARIVEDFESEEWWIEFTKFKLAATTGVSTPAFAEAHATIDEMSDEELTASMGDPMEPLVAQIPEEVFINIIGSPEEEITASAGTLAEFDAFYRPESDIPHKVIIDNDLNVYGHVGLWESCWGDDIANCIRPPRPHDNYASFNQPGVMTERGIVETGPIFAFGGHRKAKSAPTIEQAYGGIENAWCDVRVTEGKHGPWVSGKVRPGTPEEVIYAARASRISGHWVNGNLRAIVSVNVEAFNIPGNQREMIAGFAFVMDENEVVELVASFPPCKEEEPKRDENQLTLTFNGQLDANKLIQALGYTTSTPGFTTVTKTGATTTVPNSYWSMTPEKVVVVDDPIVVPETNELQEWTDAKLAELLEAEDGDLS